LLEYSKDTSSIEQEVIIISSRFKKSIVRTELAQISTTTLEKMLRK